MATGKVVQPQNPHSGIPKLPETGSDKDDDEIDEDGMQKKAEKYKLEKNAKGFEDLIEELQRKLCLPRNENVSKARAARWVRKLVDMFLETGNADEKSQVSVCLKCINWATEEKRTFLRQSLQCRLVAVYYDTKDFQEALRLGGTLLKELKKVDDKNLLVEVLLLESKTYKALGNLPRARAALTSARTTANSIYCAPFMQAELDLQSGILHAADEKDFKTAYSYFYEAFEGLDSIDHPKALVTLKYMLLCKIMLSVPEEVKSLLSGKLHLKYDGKHLEAMKGIAQAAQNRSLAEFNSVRVDFQEELEGDQVIRSHLDAVYDKMMEQNLSRIIEPYSKVQISHVAAQIGLPVSDVEKKLSQMILDKKLAGVLDQGAGLLVIFDQVEDSKAYEAALGLIQNMGKVVDGLYHKAKHLT